MLQYIYIYVYITIYIYMYVYKHICMQAYIYTNMNIVVNIQIYASTHPAYQKRQRYHAKKPCVCPVIYVAVKEPSKTEPRYAQKSPVQQQRNPE